MNFTHCNYLGDLELNKKEKNGIRLYNLPNGEWVPSITSVTSFYNRQILSSGEHGLVLKKQIALQRKQPHEEQTSTKRLNFIC